jgi:hypothetical protein
VISNLQKDAEEGSSTLEVLNQESFEKGQDVCVDPGKENEECRIIIAIGSLKLKTPLKRFHPKTAVVAGLPTGTTTPVAKVTTTPAATTTLTPGAKYAAGAATQVAGVPNPMLIVGGLFASASIVAFVFRVAQYRTRQARGYRQTEVFEMAGELENALE